MFGAIFRFLASLVALLGRLFPDSAPTRRCQQPSATATPLPAARVAIVGAGIGGCSAAYFLRELGGEALDIHVWQRKETPVGGRAAVIDFDGHQYESGAVVIHRANKYMVDFAAKFGLQMKTNKHQATIPVGIYNGKEFVFRTGTFKLWNIIKALWRYGLSLIRLDFFVQWMLYKKFSTIYNIQANGQAFETIPEMLQAIGGDYLFQLTQTSTRDYLLGKLGYPERIVDELVTPFTSMYFGQNSGSFPALVSLTAMESGSLHTVMGGIKQIPENLLRASNATLHLSEVQTITRVENNGKVSYTIEADAEDMQQTPAEFDAVIIANPLNFSKVQFINFPTPIYTSISTTPYQQVFMTFVKGEINPSFFGLVDYGSNFPHLILITALSEHLTEDCGPLALQAPCPSDVPNDQVKDYLKPVCNEPLRVWKIMTLHPLTDEEKGQMFRKIDGQVTVDWLAFPTLNPPEDCPSFVLDSGMFYINGIEKVISGTEFVTIGGKNVALLARDYLLKSTVE